MQLRIPPIVSQNLATLPDGSVDPQHSDDCGESCLCSATDATLGLYFSPGCIRQTIGSVNGYTTDEDLHRFLVRLHLGGAILYPDWTGFDGLRLAGRYLIALGHWIAPNFEHWMLAYHEDGTQIWFMDPWTASLTTRNKPQFEAQYAGIAVEVRPS